MPRVFTNVIKPTHICNISCRYCFNEDTRAPIMSTTTLERVISQTFVAATATGHTGKVDFIWHGGEPTVAGRPFFETAVEMQHRYSGGRGYENVLQTNGLLLDRAWTKFLKAEGFRVSLSIDGPRELNDLTRVDSRGRGTFERVKKSFDLLQEEEIVFGVCVVVTRANAGHTKEIYDFLAANRLPFNVIPLTLSGSARNSFDELGLAPEEYAEPWIAMYDKWFDSEEGSFVYGSDFSLKTRAILLGRPQDCIGQKICSDHHLSTDPDGFVYPCATLSGNPAWRYGNVNDESLADLLNSAVAVSARSRAVDPQCASCKWQHVCHGGCMQRAFKFTQNHNERDFYCPSLYKIYEHIEQRLREDGTTDLSKLPTRESQLAHT